MNWFHSSLLQGKHIPETISKAVSEPQLEIVHADVIQHAVRAGQVDVLEDAGGGGFWDGALPRYELAALRDDQHLPRAYVSYPLEADGTKCTVLRSHTVLGAGWAGALAQDQRPAQHMHIVSLAVQ